MWNRRLTACALAASLAAGMISGCAFGESSRRSGRGAAGGAAEEDRLSVVTTIFPQYDFVREIAGDKVDLKMLLKPGEETHSYEPTPQDIIAIQKCDVFLYVGGENDAWVEDILESMPEDADMRTLRLVDCVETVEEEHVEGMKESPGHDHEHYEEDPHDHAAEDHDHAMEEEHVHADGEHHHSEEEDVHADEGSSHSVHEIDEHVWTSPVNAMAIVDKIADLLADVDQENAQWYIDRAGAYQEKLSDLDAQLREITEHASSHLLIFGDRFPFRYLADEYGLDYYAAFPGCASDTEPSAATMAFLIRKAREVEAPAVLKMELSNANIANAVAEAAGAEVRVLYSCHNVTARQFEDGVSYLSMMQDNAKTLKEVLNGWH